MKDLYRALGVSRSFSPQSFKVTYLSKIRSCSDDKEFLENLKMAFAILSSPELRAEYDAVQDMEGMKWSIRRGVDIIDRGG